MTRKGFVSRIIRSNLIALVSRPILASWWPGRLGKHDSIGNGYSARLRDSAFKVFTWLPGSVWSSLTWAPTFEASIKGLCS